MPTPVSKKMEQQKDEGKEKETLRMWQVGLQLEWYHYPTLRGCCAVVRDAAIFPKASP